MIVIEAVLMYMASEYSIKLNKKVLSIRTILSSVTYKALFSSDKMCFGTAPCYLLMDPVVEDQTSAGV